MVESAISHNSNEKTPCIFIVIEAFLQHWYNNSTINIVVAITINTTTAAAAVVVAITTTTITTTTAVVVQVSLDSTVSSARCRLASIERDYFDRCVAVISAAQKLTDTFTMLTHSVQPYDIGMYPSCCCCYYFYYYTCHSIHLTPVSQAGLYLPAPKGWKAELALVFGYMLMWFSCPLTVPIQVLNTW